MTTRLQRFDFGSLRDFRGPAIAPIAPDIIIEEELPPPPPTFSEADLEAATAAAKKLGFAEGFEAGLARASEQADAKRQSVEAIVLSLGHQISGLAQQYQQLLSQESAELSQLVLMIARKIAGEALSERAHEATAALVARCLPVMLNKPRLMIELHPDALESTMVHVESLLQAQGFEGEIGFRPNPQLGVHDTLLDWGSGQAERRVDTLWQEIESLLAAMPVTLAPLDAMPQNNNENS